MGVSEDAEQPTAGRRVADGQGGETDSGEGEEESEAGGWQLLRSNVSHGRRFQVWLLCTSFSYAAESCLK